MSLDFYIYEKQQYHFADDIVMDLWIDKYSYNITHNLTVMAEKCEVDGVNLYQLLWHPRANGYEYAKDLIIPLEKCLNRLELEEEYFKTFNSSNGWGIYEHFVPFVKRVLEGCKDCPDGIICTDV